MKRAVKKRYAPTGSTAMEDKFIADMEALGDWIIVREITPRCFGDRKFRIDVTVSNMTDTAWVEIQGGSHRGAHATVKGRTRDAEKLALSHFCRMPLFHFTSPMVRDGRAAEIVAAFLNGEEAPACIQAAPKTRRKRRRK